MHFREYDIIVDTIEENIKANLNDILCILKSKLGMTSGKIESIFNDCYPDEITLNNYYKDRKAYRTMEAIMANPDKSNEDIAEEFGYTGYTVFFRWFKRIYGRSPKEVVALDKYKVPSVMHAREIIENDEALAPTNRVAKVRNDEHMNIELMLIDKVTDLRDRMSELKREIRNEKDKSRLEVLEYELQELRTEIDNTEAILTVHIKEPIVIKNLTPGLYAEFTRIEECRRIYGIEIDKMIDLYNKSVEHNMPLYELCDIFAEDIFLDGMYIAAELLEDPDMSYLEDEMSLEESWRYYKDDDAVDPYGLVVESGDDNEF